jgi:phosphoribosylaminoimidazole-succinocarboxamide synthase
MIIAQGKTKIIKQGVDENTVILETKDVLTGGDAAKREVIEDIGTYKTTQTTNIFRLINKRGIPTAFIERKSDNELLCYKCDMLPLEFVARRYAFGSYLLRHPDMKDIGGLPIRFSKPIWEIFHKSAIITQPITYMPYQLEEGKAREKFLHEGIWEEGVYTDPFVHSQCGKWSLASAKQDVILAKPLMLIDPVCSKPDLEYIIYKLLLPAFSLLEAALKRVDTKHGGINLVDLKIEIGIRVDNGQLVIADVIDNDSWRIWVGGNPQHQLDKQCFRDGDPLTTVAENYKIVAAITERFGNSAQ